MKTITLAAGLGSRLRPHTDTKPKCMVPFLGTPILQRQFSVFKRAGISERYLISGYKNEKIKAEGFFEYHNSHFDSTNMVYSLALARELFDGESPIIIAYGDIIFSDNVLSALLTTEGDFCVVADENWEPYWRQRMPDYWTDVESFQLNEEGFISSIGQKWETKKEVQAQYIGLMKISPPFHKYMRDRLAEIEATPEFHNMYMTDFLQKLIVEGFNLTPVIVSSGWLEFDQPEDLRTEFEKFLNA